MNEPTLFDLPATPDEQRAAARMPIAPTVSYLAAVERSGGQCEHQTPPRSQFGKSVRCSRSLAGGWRLFLAGDELVCQTHYDARVKPKAPRKSTSKKIATGA